ncbi:jg11824 [Pararge aegeria aegeria]|uniref:Jg11824 protein n=4 Tax=Pararge aegeria TaxID=116150 RepID=A0A8S4S8T1_9NEOP|nr:jg11824 [Pararge aegeria aegeria]
MFKLILILILVVLVGDSIGQRPYIIYPTYRPPPPQEPLIRSARAVPEKPLLLFQGNQNPQDPSSEDYALLTIIDDVGMNPEKRLARSSSFRGAAEYRMKRNVYFKPRLPPTFPYPRPSGPFIPRPGPPRQPYPIYANH